MPTQSLVIYAQVAQLFLTRRLSSEKGFENKMRRPFKYHWLRSNNVVLGRR